MQVFKADIELASTSSRELLRVTRLDPRRVPEGRPFTLLRVHASCCGTPLFNTWRELPTCSFFAANAIADGGSGAASLARPPQWRLNTAWARAAPAAAALLEPRGTPGFPALFLLRFIARNWAFSQRATPAPFELPLPAACAEWGGE